MRLWKGEEMVPEGSIICTSCEKRGVIRHLTLKEREGCQRLGIPPTCAADVRSWMAHKQKEEEDAKRQAAAEWNAQKAAGRRARRSEPVKTGEVTITEAAEKLGLGRKFFTDKVLAKGLLQYRRLDDPWKRMVVKKDDLENLLQAALNDETWIPDLVRELIRLGQASKHE